MIPLFIEALTKMIRRDLEGKSAQQKMMITPNRFPTKSQENEGIAASILLLLYPLEREWFFFLQSEVKMLNTIKAKYLSQGEWLKRMNLR